MSKKKIFGGLLGFMILGLGASYFAGRYYFADHYYPNTRVNGVDISYKSQKEALDLVEDHLADYQLTIHSEEGDLLVTSQDAGLVYESGDDMAGFLHAQQVDTWFQEFFADHDYAATRVSLDKDKLHDYVSNLACMNPSEKRVSEDARIKYDKASKSYLVIDEIIGNDIVKKKFQQAVYDAVMNLDQELDLGTNEYYRQPKYFHDNKKVLKAKETVDRYISTVIHYEDAGLSALLDVDKIHTFVEISKDFAVTLNNEKMVDFIKKELSPVFNTVGKKRTINSPGSGKFTASGGTYGWQVGLAAERDAMLADIKKGEEVTREPQYLQDAAKKDRKNDIGDSYVDVNIEKQELYVVKDGKIEMQSSFVSGDATKGHDTDKGIFMVEFKRNDYEIRDYHVTVKYWMPFNTEFGEGFHDAVWRGSFGGSIYKGNGSHGCVNLPYEVAKKMFETIPIGYPVIVH